MLWKVDEEVMKTPSTFKIDSEDIDKDSYRSTVTAALIDTIIAKGMHQLQFGYDYLTEAEAENILSKTFKNPMNIWIKSPNIIGGIMIAPFRCAKRSAEMYRTSNDEGVSENKWKVSFNLSQKKKTIVQ